MNDMIVAFCISAFPTFPFGMLFGLVTLLPPIRRWNHSIVRKIVTSIVLALFAISVFQPVGTYVNVQVTIYWSREMSGSEYIDDLLNGSKAEVEKELFIRFIRPRLESRPCYSEQISICKITDKIETTAMEGGVPMKQSIQNYELLLGINWFWLWLGCLNTVRLVTKKNSGQRLIQSASGV